MNITPLPDASEAFAYIVLRQIASEGFKNEATATAVVMSFMDNLTGLLRNLHNEREALKVEISRLKGVLENVLHTAKQPHYGCTEIQLGFFHDALELVRNELETKP
jgi:hypothetical protein